jgi:hypothetical protein
MPFLDAKALKSDRKGLAFLRDVLRRRIPGIPPKQRQAAPPESSDESVPPRAENTPR